MITLFGVQEEAKIIHEAVLTKWTEILDGGKFIGAYDQAFEEAFAETVNSKCYVVGCASGTDALVLALRALEFKPGDRILVPALTFTATAEAAHRVTGNVVFTDVRQNGSINAIASTVSADGIIPVHLWGVPVELKLLTEPFAKKFKIVEDCSQAYGMDGIGEHSDVATFSFYPTKSLGGAGDGGAVLTKNPYLAERLRILKNHGRFRTPNDHLVCGYNSRLDSLQAVYLIEKLKYAKEWISKRKEIAKVYQDTLSSVEGLDVLKTESGYVQPIVCSNRDKVQAELAKYEIQSGVHYPIPLHLQPAWSHLGYAPGSFPTAEKLCQTVLSLPCHPHLSSEDVDLICEIVGNTAK